MGIVFNIQEFSVNDGRGIRTSVFLKGCPLNCKWCSNPEGQRSDIEIFHNKTFCEKCKLCFSVCGLSAVSFDNEGFPVFMRDICSKCREKPCVKTCPNNALKLTGEKISAKELFNKIKTNYLFFRNSGGGITLTGGEPLMQYEFVSEILSMCKSAGINTGVETCGMFDWDNLKGFISDFDFYYFDIKTTDPEKHKEFTGCDNKRIIENFLCLCKTEAEKVTVSIPLINGFNDEERIINDISSLCKEAGISSVRLLPYHNLGESKYGMLGRKYNGKLFGAVPQGKINSYRNIFIKENFNCYVK